MGSPLAGDKTWKAQSTGVTGALGTVHLQVLFPPTHPLGACLKGEDPCPPRQWPGFMGPSDGRESLDLVHDLYSFPRSLALPGKDTSVDNVIEMH